MSDTVAAHAPARPGSTFSSTTVRKAAAAVSGAFMAGWLVLHVLGNLTAFGGAAHMNAYAAALHRQGPLLWLVRSALLTAAAVHVAATLSLAKRARDARPRRAVQAWPRGGVTSRTALVVGPLLLVFVVYHLLHMTFGVVHPAFESGHVYENLVSGLAPPAVAIVYVVAAALAGVHLYRGLASALSSIGLECATRRRARIVSATFAVALAAAFAAIPFAVLAGVLR